MDLQFKTLTFKVLRHGYENGQNQTFLRKKRAKFAGCLHDKDHINLPRKSHLLLFLYDLWHKNLQFVLKVNIKSGKQYYKVI